MLGENEGTPYVYPLIIDGMMLVATIALIDLGHLARAVAELEEAAKQPVFDPQVARRSASATKAAQNRHKNA